MTTAHMTVTILDESHTSITTTGATPVILTTDDDTGTVVVSTGTRSRDHRTTTEHKTLTSAWADAFARLASMARAAASTELFAV